MRTLKAVASIFRIEAASGMQYRLSALTGAATSIFYAIIETIVMRIFYMYADRYTAGLDAGMSMTQAVSYIWLAQLAFMLQNGNIDSSIADKITKGDVGIELCRPLDLYYHWFARLTASRVAPFILRGLPIVVVGLLMPEGYRLCPPASFAGLLAMCVTLISALFLIGSVTSLAHSLLLNIRWGNGPVYIFLLLTSVLSGTYLPLQLWPASLQTFLLYQPFAGFADIPLRLYIGTLPASSVFWVLGLQLGWSLLFILVGKSIMHHNLRRLVVQGG